MLTYHHYSEDILRALLVSTVLARRVASKIEYAHAKHGDVVLDALFEHLEQAVDIIGYLENRGWTAPRHKETT